MDSVLAEIVVNYGGVPPWYFRIQALEQTVTVQDIRTGVVVVFEKSEKIKYNAGMLNHPRVGSVWDGVGWDTDVLNSLVEDYIFKVYVFEPDDQE